MLPGASIREALLKRATVSSVYAIMVTFRRPSDAKATSAALTEQSRSPDHVWVIDNDPSDESASHFACLPKFTYLGQSANLGPAGGIAVGMTAVLASAEDDDWVLLVDDDDPPASADVIEHLLALSSGVRASHLGGVALIGARYNTRTGLVQRILDAELSGVVSADFFAGNQFPMYSVRAIRDAGVFDSSLFFGFEDLDLGLRLRSYGLRLQTIDTDHAVSDSSLNRTSWREYFKTRALVVVCRRHLGPTALVATVVRSLVGGSLLLLLRDRRPELAAARWRGALDGIRGRMGERGWAPSDNPSKT